MKRISIIIPAKDEEKRLPRFLRTVIDYCRRSSHEYEIIVVDDGSTDQTVSAAMAFRKEFPALKAISLDRNHGKGYAVKQGFLASKGDIVLFLDADGSTGPEEIERHLDLFEKEYDIVIGSRVMTDGKSQVKTLSYRKWMGSIFNFLVSSILIKGIKDTQCGFKMFRAPIIPALFGDLYLEGFGFDLEILYLAQQKNLRIKEVAVNWEHVDGSKVNILKDSMRMFWNIIEIRSLHHQKAVKRSFSACWLGRVLMILIAATGSWGCLQYATGHFKSERQIIFLNRTLPDFHQLINCEKQGIAAVPRESLKEYADYFKLVTEAMPDNSDGALVLGYLDAMTGHSPKADILFKEAYRLDPQSFFATYDMALACYQQGQYAQSADLLQKALAMAPQTALKRMMSSLIYRQIFASVDDRNDIIVALKQAYDDAYVLLTQSMAHSSPHGEMINGNTPAHAHFM